MVKINPQVIRGSWQAGVALDVHTVSSTPIGVNEARRTVFETKRSAVGELLYRLKYSGDVTASEELIEAAVGFLMPHATKLDLIVPVPASRARPVQPVTVLADGIGKRLGLRVADCMRTTRERTQIKAVTDLEERRKLLEGLYTVDSSITEGMSILLLDDLFRSGATMNAVTDVLMSAGKAASVRALTMTRTRSKQ